MIKLISAFGLKLNTKKGLYIVLGSILVFNIFLYLRSEKVDFTSQIQSRRDATGFSADKAHKFIYFYYYTGRFPLATINKDLEYNSQAALKEIEDNGENLIMEYQHWSRLGENARIWAYMPNALVRGSPEEPSIKLFNAIVFISSLLILFFGFWRIKQSLLGFLLLLSINLTPFFWYEVYSRENIFSLLGSGFFIILGLNVAILFGGRLFRTKAISIAALSGIVVGFLSEFRNELSIVLLALLLIYILSNHLSLKYKLGFCLVIFLSFFLSKKVIRGYFNRNFEKTTELVESKGGHVYTGARISGHKTWHAIYCGLGDFDTKYGYRWDDRIAYWYAVPILNSKYNLNIRYTGKYHTDNYYDEEKLYYVKFDEIPQYEEVIRAKVLTDIFSDPSWYANIIIKRISKTLSTTIPIPYIGWSLFLLALLLLVTKNYTYLRLLVVSLPLSATSIVVYSAKGSTYNSLFVYFVIVLSLMELYRLASNIAEKEELSVTLEEVASVDFSDHDFTIDQDHTIDTEDIIDDVDELD